MQIKDKKFLVFSSLFVFAMLVVSYVGWMMEVAPIASSVIPHKVACTDEALICPDGTGVGRNGPTCTLTPCPSTGSITGVYMSSAEGARLAVAAPAGVESGAAYAVPLDLSSLSVDEKLIGTTVTFQGGFTEGNTFHVSGIIPIKNNGGTPKPATSPTTAKIKVGATVFVGGMKITLNKIVSDSRCASDVQCIWAGNTTANVTLKSDTDAETIDMVSGVVHPFDMHEVSIIDVVPVMKSNVRINRDGYTLTFLVEPLATSTPRGK